MSPTCDRCGDEVERVAPLNGNGVQACDDCRLDVAVAKATKALSAPGVLEQIKRAGSQAFKRPELRST